MKSLKLLPVLGINRLAPHDALASQSGNFLRDAVNVDIDSTGRVSLRGTPSLVTQEKYEDLWQSPLHKDIFARLGDEWVKIDQQWNYEKLITIGNGECYHALLNNRVVVAGKLGLYIYDGNKALPLTIPTPPAPYASTNEGGLDKGQYIIAIAWLRDNMQSAVSPNQVIDVPDNNGVTITLPKCLDDTVTGVRVFASKPNGAALYRLGDYPIETLQATLTNELLGAASFENMSVMPTGKYLCLWRGRLVTATANRLMFSQPLAYHIHDERFDFFLLPQRITFIIPVNSGLWVGLTDSVVFLAGANPNELYIAKKGSGAPVPGSALTVKPETIGDMAQGHDCALWLSSNGYCIGLANGEIVEPQSDRISDISTVNPGVSVRFNDRVITVLR